MDASIRSKLIRLAHSNPAIREHVLPLLKEAGFDKSPLGREYAVLDEEYLMDMVDSGAKFRIGPTTTPSMEIAARMHQHLQAKYPNATLVHNERTGEVSLMVLKPLNASLK